MAENFPSCADKDSRYHFNRVFLSAPLLCDRFLIYQLGELFCNDCQIIEPHRQFCPELTFIQSGEGEIATGGERVSVKKDDLYISFTDDIHAIYSSQKAPLRYCFCGFQPNDVDAIELLGVISKLVSDSGVRVVSLPSAAGDFNNMMSETQNPAPFSNRMIGLSLHGILVGAARALDQSGGERHGYKITEKSMLVYRMISYMENHACELTRLSELEEVFYFKYRYLEKVFRQIMGQTISQYLRCLRIDRAKEMLADGKSVTEVSDMLNYSSICAFSKAFTAHTGVSPAQFRKNQSLL